MTTPAYRSRRPALLLAALLLAAAPALKAADEGIDPMRQITEQMDSANLLLVQDVTGSMQWDFRGASLSYRENSTGNLFWNEGCYYTGGCDDGTGNTTRTVLNKTWGIGNRLVPAAASSDCSSGNCRYWTYVLFFELPSRLAIVKNALGNHVSIVNSYLPPPFVTENDPGFYSWTTATTNTAFQGNWRTPPAGATVTTFAYDPADQNDIQFWVYTIDYGQTTERYWDSGCRCYRTRTVPVRGPNPGIPFAAIGANDRPALNATQTGCLFGTCEYVTPKRVIDINRDRVNWGLLTYSTDNRNAANAVRIYDVDPRGGNPNLTNILNSYRLNTRTTFGRTVPDGHSLGLIAQGSTNTTPTLWKTTADTSSAKGANNSLTRSRNLYSTCPAPYGVILVTDGESNSGNPNGSAWSRCYENAGAYPAGSSHRLYSLFNRNPKVNTWAIGISEDVGACELNFTAYSGRTDADSPRGDAGYSGYVAATADDPGNPYVAEPTADISALSTFDDHYDTAHGSNAFFPEDSEALRAAITAIVNATATGDYTTNAPVSGLTAGFQSIVYLPSTGFPNWRGHFYAFDTTKPQFLDPPTNKVPNPGYEKWDAALKLNARSAAERKIFTWEEANNGTFDLVEVTTTNLSTLQTLAGTTDLTAAVVDFIRGNDGTLTNTARPWKLGPLINTAPAIVATPEKWTQGHVPSHTDMERLSRDPLLFVGSNSGMMHAFRVVDGEEQIALLPPGLLSRQIALYQNYLANRLRTTGQPPDPADHLYGVANSFRFGDVRIGKDYRTIGIITLGLGGDEVAGIDVTKIPRPDANPYNNPVKILWSKSSTTLPGLRRTWSIPAMAPTKKGTGSTDDGDWRLLMGSGFDVANSADTQKDPTNLGFVKPKAFTLDPSNGSLLQTKEVETTTGATHGHFVGNQAFADTVLFDPTAPSYKPDNIALLGVQADLNGRIWFLWTPSSASGNDFSGTPVKAVDTTLLQGVTQSQPFYYNPAASGYGAYNKIDGANGEEKLGCAAYAFGSGSLYEKSAAITGEDVGTSGFFIPRLYVATTEKPSVTSGYKLTTAPAALADSQIWNRAISGQWCIDKCGDADPTKWVMRTLHASAQLTAPPFLLAPKDDTQTITALFLVYDPEEGCNGNSYVLQVDFKGTGNQCNLRKNDGSYDITYRAFNAGEGAASGFTIAGTKVLVAQSGVGEGQRAKLYEPEGLAASLAGGVEPRVRWWKELK